MPQSPVFNTQASLALTQFFSLNGIFPSRGGGGSDAIYLGSIRTFAGNFDPGGSADANGQLLQIRNNTAVFSLLGTNFGGDGTSTFGLPNLNGTALVGSGTAAGLGQFDLGTTAGAANETLTVAELPPNLGGTSSGVDNYQPSLPVTYLIHTGGIFPSRDGIGAPSVGLIGEIVPFAGNFAPDGYMVAAGQLLSIRDNTALFSILGTTYGGDGRTTFALPDLRGRDITGWSGINGVGTQLGDRVGTATVALQNGQAPDGHGAPWCKRSTTASRRSH